MTEYKYTTCVNSDNFDNGRAKILIISSTDHMFSIEGISTTHIRIRIHVTNKIQQTPGRGQIFLPCRKIFLGFSFHDFCFQSLAYNVTIRCKNIFE